MNAFIIISVSFLLGLLMTWPGGSANGQPLLLKDTRITGHARFDIRGQYGTIPTQTVAIERDYEWWLPGEVGFWAYQLETGVQAVFSERITTRLTFRTTGINADRDYLVWGNEVPLKIRLREASIRLNRLWFSNLALEGGRQIVHYPLFTMYDYVGGRLVFQAKPWLMVDWGQWQVFEGRTLDQPGISSDDIDLWGPRLRFQTPRGQGDVYALINSKAGGSDGIGINTKIFGIHSEVPWTPYLTVEATGVWQHGQKSAPVVGERKVRAWAFRGRIHMVLQYGIKLHGEYWAGSSDDVATTNTDESFQQFNYRNTLDKSSLLYRPGLTNLRLVRGTLQGPVGQHLKGKISMVRIGEGPSDRYLGTELNIAIEYAYSEHTHLRWRWGTTTDGQRIQMFEMSAGFGE